MPSPLRVMTYNVHGLKDDHVAAEEVLRAADADVVALQEPPRGPRGRRRLERFSARAGYAVAVGGGGARTTALLVRRGLPVRAARSMRLPWRVGRVRRGISHAEVAGILVIAVHLGLSHAERAQHLARLLPLVGAAPTPVVLAGDLNEEPGGPVRRRLELYLRDVTATAGPTFPARRPRARIDAVHARGLLATGARVLGDATARRASDHLPVVVDVRLP